MDEKYIILTNASEIDPVLWGQFVNSHPAGNIFHTPEYYHLITSTPKHEAIVICCFEGGDIAGLLLATVVRTFPRPFSRITTRSIVWGGPLIKNNDPVIASLLLNEYNLRESLIVLFTQFRNLTDMSLLGPAFTENKYRYEDHLNILIDLGKGKDAIWSEFHATRRKQINRSLRRGVIVTKGDPADKALMDKCYSLLSIVYKREGLPFPDPAFFEKAADIFGEKGSLKLFIAWHENELIGFRMVLAFKGLLYDWYAAANDDFLDKYPNDILPWEIFCQGIEEGYEKFDFGGAGKPGVPYGVRDYKSKFGGELVNYGRYTLIHKPLFYRIVMHLFELRRKLIKRK